MQTRKQTVQVVYIPRCLIRGWSLLFLITTTTVTTPLPTTTTTTTTTATTLFCCPRNRYLGSSQYSLLLDKQRTEVRGRRQCCIQPQSQLSSSCHRSYPRRSEQASYKHLQQRNRYRGDLLPPFQRREHPPHPSARQPSNRLLLPIIFATRTVTRKIPIFS